MKKLIWFVLLSASMAYGQTPTYGRYQNCSLQTALGQAVAGAQVWFLTQPANTTDLTPQASVYSSSTGGAIMQPVLTDGYGQCSAYLVPGIYTVVYVSKVTGKLVYPDQSISIGGGTTAGVISINSQTGIVSGAAFLGATSPFTATQTFQAGTISYNNQIIIPSTPATGSSNVNSPALLTAGNYWNGASSATDQWFWNTYLGAGANPTTTYTLTHNGSSGAATVDIPYPITVASCTGCGGGSGDVNPSPQYRLFQQPSPGTVAVAGPTNISTDATGNNLNIPGAGQFNAQNYSQDSGTNFGHGIPNAQTLTYSNRLNSLAPSGQQGIFNQAVTGLGQTINFNAGTNGTLINNGGFNNYGGVNLSIYSHVNAQGGGIYDTTVYSMGGNDVVGNTWNVFCWGMRRGDNEGCEPDRQFWNALYQWYGGTVAPLGNDSLGNPIFRTTQTTGYNIALSAEDEFAIDLTQALATTGNIASIGTDTDTHFIQLVGDGSSNWTTLLGTSTSTTVTGGADTQQYGSSNTACTATGTYNFDPYAGDAWGNGSLTQHKCIAVGSTSGMSAGTILWIGEGGSNVEMEAVQSVVDSTHVTVALKYQHLAGETVSFGGGVGYAACPAADITPANTVNYEGVTQPLPQHMCWPVVKSLAGNKLAVFVNSDIPFGNAELHSFSLPANTAPTPMTITLTTSGTTVTAVTGNANNYNVSSTVTTRLLPAPTLTYSGFTTNPVINLVVDQSTASQYDPMLVSGGTCASAGCAGASVTVQSTYPNALNIYPMAITKYVTDPNTGCTPYSYNSSSGCPNNGWLTVEKTPASSFGTTGDTIEVTPSPNNYFHSQKHYNGQVNAILSGRSGSFFQTTYSGLGTSNHAATASPLIDELNVQNYSFLQGYAVNGWLPGNPSLPPCNPTVIEPTSPCYASWDGVMSPIDVHHWSGAYNNYLVINNPPTPLGRRLGPVASNRPVGAVISIGCNKSQTGYTLANRCDPAAGTGQAPIYDPFYLAQVQYGTAPGISFWPGQSNSIHLEGNVLATGNLAGAVITANELQSNDKLLFPTSGPGYIIMQNVGTGSASFTIENGGTVGGQYGQITLGHQAYIDGYGSIHLTTSAGYQGLYFPAGNSLVAPSGNQWDFIPTNPSTSTTQIILGDPSGSPGLLAKAGVGDIFAFGIAGGAGAFDATTFKVLNNSGSASVSLGWAGSSNSSFNFPGTPPASSGYYLTSDTSGNTSWAALSGSIGTDMWWTQSVGCSAGGTVGDTCAGTVQLPSNMPDASYFVQCVTVGIAGGSYAMTMTTNPTLMPTSSGSNIDFEITTTASPGGSQTIQATCHAHHN